MPEPAPVLRRATISSLLLLGLLLGIVSACTSNVSNPPLARFVGKWGTEGTGDGQFNMPVDVAVDGAVNVYVLDTDSNRVQKFTSGGRFLGKWGSRGSGDGQFYEPYGIAVDGSGNVYVADTQVGRVQKFASDGRFLGKWGSASVSGYSESSGGVGIVVDGAGNVYVANKLEVRVFSSDGRFLGRWGSPGHGDGQFSFTGGIAADGTGNVYVADWDDNRVQKFAVR